MDVVIKGTVAQVRSESIGQHRFAEWIVDQVLAGGASRVVRVCVPDRLSRNAEQVVAGDHVVVDGHKRVARFAFRSERDLATEVVATKIEVAR